MTTADPARQIPAPASCQSNRGAHASRIGGEDQQGRGDRLSVSLPCVPSLGWWQASSLCEIQAGSLPPPLIPHLSEPCVLRCLDAARLGGAAEVREGDVIE